MSDVPGEGRPASGRPSSRPEEPAPAGAAPWAPLDRALSAYRTGDRTASVRMRTDVGGEEEVPAALFFRPPGELSPVESAALAGARGRVLDLGAGAGAHALPLQAASHRVTALEILPEGRRALAEGGVADVRAGGVEAVAPEERFDTVLVLMNGLGLAGSLAGLPPFLASLAGVLAEGGQILADSTDPREWDDPTDGRYPGEVHMQLGFRDGWGPPFPFLFVDPERLAAAAREAGLEVEVVAGEEGGRYLARLTVPPRPVGP